MYKFSVIVLVAIFLTAANWSGSGSAVTLPASSTDNAVVRWDGTTGASVQDANEVTIGDSGATLIDLTADVAGLTIQGHSSQTAKSFTVEASTGTDVATIDNSGNLVLTGDITLDGADTISGHLQKQTASTTVAITASQCGETLVSNSADVMTLPEASTVLGCRLTFVCGTADDFDIDPADATDVIGKVVSVTGTNTTTVLAPAAGDEIRCTDLGSSIVLEAVAADLWVSIGGANGTWTDVD